MDGQQDFRLQMKRAAIIRLCAVRHGETEENIARILQGHLPGRLSPLGREQARSLSRRLCREDFDAIVSSDLQRVVDTVRLMFDGEPAIPWECSSLFREIDWGSLTGTRIADADLRHLPPDVETRFQLYQRAGRALDYLRSRYGGTTLLLVSHGLFLRSLLAHALHCPYESLHTVPHLDNCEARWVEVQSTVIED